MFVLRGQFQTFLLQTIQKARARLQVKNNFSVLSNGLALRNVRKICVDLVEVGRPVDDGEEDVHSGLVGNDVNLIYNKQNTLELKPKR